MSLLTRVSGSRLSAVVRFGGREGTIRHLKNQESIQNPNFRVKLNRDLDSLNRIFDSNLDMLNHDSQKEVNGALGTFILLSTKPTYNRHIKKTE